MLGAGVLLENGAGSGGANIISSGICTVAGCTCHDGDGHRCWWWWPLLSRLLEMVTTVVIFVVASGDHNRGQGRWEWLALSEGGCVRSNGRGAYLLFLLLTELGLGVCVLVAASVVEAVVIVAGGGGGGGGYPCKELDFKKSLGVL